MKSNIRNRMELSKTAEAKPTASASHSRSGGDSPVSDAVKQNGHMFVKRVSMQ